MAACPRKGIILQEGFQVAPPVSMQVGFEGLYWVQMSTSKSLGKAGQKECFSDFEFSCFLSMLSDVLHISGESSGIRSYMQKYIPLKLGL